MIRMTSTVATLVLLLAASGSSQAQNPAACQSVRFSDEVLSRFPDAPKSCLDVITRDGQQYAVIKARLQDVRGNSVRVRVHNPDGTQGPLTTIRTSPGRKVLIDGKPYPLSEVATDQDLTAYIRVDAPMIALAPATETEPVEAVAMAAPEPTRVAEAPPTMPHTANQFGTLMLMGLFLIAVAFGVRATRRRDK